LYIIQNKIQNSIVKKIIIFIACFMLFALSGCIRIEVPSKTNASKVIKKAFDVRSLVAKLNEYKNYSFTVTKIYHDENGNNPEVSCIYIITYFGDMNKYKETRNSGVLTDIIYIHPDENIMYSYDPYTNIYTTDPLDEEEIEDFYAYKNILYILKIFGDLEEWHYVLLSEDEEVAGEPCVLVEDGHYYGSRKIYISKNTGFPIRIEHDDDTIITVTDIEIENISDTEFTVPAGAEYRPDWPSQDMVNGPY